VILSAECAAAAATAVAAVEQHQLAPEPLKHDLGRIAVVTRLVGPFAGLDLAFEIDLRPLAQIILGHPAEVLVEDHHLVPFGALLSLAVLALPALGSGDAQVDHLAAVVERTGLGIRSQIADQDHLIHASHVDLLISRSSYQPSATV